MLTLQVQDHAGIEIAATCAHDQAIQCSESHGGVDAAAGLHRAQARTVSQMPSDHSTSCERWRSLEQSGSNIFVRNTVKAITAYTGGFIFARQREARRDGGHQMMESGVEADHLRQAGSGVRNRPDGCDIVWLMQRRQRCQKVKFRKQFGGDEFRCDMIAAAVYHAMADRNQLIIAKAGFHPDNYLLHQ